MKSAPTISKGNGIEKGVFMGLFFASMVLGGAAVVFAPLIIDFLFFALGPDMWSAECQLKTAIAGIAAASFMVVFLVAYALTSPKPSKQRKSWVSAEDF